MSLTFEIHFCSQQTINIAVLLHWTISNQTNDVKLPKIIIIIETQKSESHKKPKCQRFKCILK